MDWQLVASYFTVKSTDILPCTVNKFVRLRVDPTKEGRKQENGRVVSPENVVHIHLYLQWTNNRIAITYIHFKP